jgi:hypothetical protein
MSSHSHAWLRLHVGGQTWGFYLVNAGHKRLQDEEEHVYGITYPEECRVYLARGTQEAVEEAFVHELEHLINHASGASHEIGNAKKEERIVRDTTPLRHQILKDLGFRFPKVNP